MRDAGYGRPAAVVIGAGEVGSAIAVALHRAGCAVVVTDEIDPAWPRRGMAFTNAWYIGNAELDGEAAVFCASLKSIPSILDRHRAIAATTWSWAGIAAALDPVCIIDATLRGPGAGGLPGTRGSGQAITLAIVPAPVGVPSVDVVLGCPPEAESVTGGGNVARAVRSGRFATSRRIGDRVAAGEIVGGVGALPVAAPCDGVLRGLAARGARIAEGAPLVEVDARGDPVLCFGLEPRAVVIANDVLRAAALLGVISLGAPASLANEIVRAEA